MRRIAVPGVIVLLLIFTLLSCSKKTQPPPKPEPTLLVLQPGQDKGQDCLVAYRETDNDLYANANHSPNPDVTAIRWTYHADNAGEGTNRTYIKFTGLSDIPANAEITEAKLSLFGVETGVAAALGNSYYTGSPYAETGDNAAWLKRVTADWDESTITWSNKPETSDEYQAAVPASTSQWNFDVTGIDVTNMVKRMVNSNENFGFCLQLKSESIYKSILFGSSEASDESKRPKLEVKYIVKN